MYDDFIKPGTEVTIKIAFSIENSETCTGIAGDNFRGIDEASRYDYYYIIDWIEQPRYSPGYHFYDSEGKCKKNYLYSELKLLWGEKWKKLAKDYQNA